MKIAIIADTHDNLANIKKILDWLKKEKINKVIHCGDVCTVFTLKEGFGPFPGEMYISLGNADFEAPEKYKLSPNFFIFEKSGEINIGGKKIAFTHGRGEAENLVKTKKYNLVFFGHTHTPWEEKKGGTRLVNPGEAGGDFDPATFAIYDTEKDNLELKIIEQLT